MKVTPDSTSSPAPDPDALWTEILAGLEGRHPGINAEALSPAGLRNLRKIASCRDAMAACSHPELAGRRAPAEGPVLPEGGAQ